MNSMKANLRDTRNGQAMLIAVLSLGGAMLGATTVAGLLILLQIRQTTDTLNSAKAIFAADAGVEYALYDFYCPLSARCAPPPEPELPIFTNGATTSVTCYDDVNATTTCGNASATAAISKGTSLSSRRAFFVNLASATSTFP